MRESSLKFYGCRIKTFRNDNGEVTNAYYFNIMAIKRNGLYIGVINNLTIRVHKQKNDLIKGLTTKYGVCNLVYYEKSMI